jgi:hypothetical protein
MEALTSTASLITLTPSNDSTADGDIPE